MKKDEVVMEIPRESHTNITDASIQKMLSQTQKPAAFAVGFLAPPAGIEPTTNP